MSGDRSIRKKRKPPQKAEVIALRGKFKTEVVTQETLRSLESAQRIEWSASKRAALLSEQVKAALERGAQMESGSLYFDRELELVRSVRKEGSA